MGILKVLTFVLVSVTGLCHGAYVETLNKCKFEDKACHRGLIQKVLKDIALTGIPELEIPPVDPIELKNINASILDVVTLELVDGVAKGAKDCVIENSDLNIDRLHASIQLTCDIHISGKYKVMSSSPAITSLLGGKIHGDGNGKVSVHKITLTIEFPFEVIRKGNDVFFTSKLKNYKYTYDVKGKVVFDADSIYLGDKESSKDIVKLMNENWKLILDSFGKHFVDIAIKYVNKFLLLFFEKVPAKNYLLDDLSNL